jgi:hypothetical protein
MEQAGTRKRYTPPTLKAWGTVAELTQTGNTREGGDAKGGSASSQGV